MSHASLLPDATAGRYGRRHAIIREREMISTSAEPSPVIPDDQALVLNFESIGDNCELGILQRRAGVEPLGLLRFAGAPLPHLLRALKARFAGIRDPGGIRVRAENGEFMVLLTRYEMVYHADVKVGEKDPDVVRRQQTRTVGFLVEKLIADLEKPTKILVFRQNEPLLAADLNDLRVALAAYGPGTLLWVQAARPGHPPGTAERIDGGLLAGYVERLAPREQVPDLHVPSWMTMLRRAYALWRDGAKATTGVPRRVELQFGAAGNAAPFQGEGWSTPETGFTWAINDRSRLAIDLPVPAANDWWLEMDVVPFEAPPLLPAQSLDIVVNGTTVHRFDPLLRGEVSCRIPAEAVANRPVIDLGLEHPRAASPRKVAGHQDDRRLGMAFRTLSLTAIEP